MEITTRAAAKLAGQNIYYTGRPCKNGHLTYRYVQSGTCRGCIDGDHATSTEVDPKREARIAAAAVEERAKVARREARAQLVQIKLRLFDADLATIKAAAYAFGAMRFPGLLAGDTYPGLLSVDHSGGTALYKFNCHSEDIEPLRAMAVALTNGRSINGAEVRAAILQATLAGIEVDPAPEWKP